MDSRELSTEQAQMWNGSSARAWIDGQQMLDTMFRRFEPLMVAGAGSARRVLDVGCGTGTTTLALARARPARGQCTGIDISQPMIDIARNRIGSEPADFLCDDAETHDFTPATYDAIVSRFGVMFFGDPVRAFANLRGAICAGGNLCAFVWRSPDENPYMTAAEQAAACFLPEAPPRDPHAPGQFAFADATRVRGILEASGWSAVELQPVDVPCAFPAASLDQYMTRMGPLARTLAMLDDEQRAPIVAAMRTAFGPFVHGDEVRFTSACWRVVARA